MTTGVETKGNDIIIPDNCVLEFFWIAEYKGGDGLAQFDERGNERYFKDIDFDNLRRFHFVNVNTSKKVSVEINDDSRVIAFRRHKRPLSLRTYDLGADDIMYAIGFQKTVSGKNVKAIMYISSDGEIILKDE